MNRKKLTGSTALRKVVGCVALYGIIQILLSTRILSDYYFATLVTIGINVILAVSLNMITGFTGQFSLGHAGFSPLALTSAPSSPCGWTGSPGSCWVFWQAVRQRLWRGCW